MAAGRFSDWSPWGIKIGPCDFAYTTRDHGAFLDSGEGAYESYND